MLEPIDEFSNEYRWLSNFQKCTLEIGDISFHSVEQAYQYYKCAKAEDREKMLSLPTAGQCKRFARGVEVHEKFHSKKLELMERLTLEKYTQNPDLRKKLIATGERPLIEGNWWHDVFWGMHDGKGENHLGKILMKVRKELA